MMRNSLWFALTCSFVCLAVATAGAKPDIVFVVADDLGWSDVGFHGGRTPTPHLDQLARENVELTQHYVAATCSPTRVSLLTGRFWSRFGVLNPLNTRALPWDTLTLPRALADAGYDTALIGKWHLGSKPESGPAHYGFDYSYGSLAGGVGPYNHFYKKGEFSRTWHRNGRLITEQGHVTDLLTDEAIAWIGRRTEAPFFLYVPFTAVHLPLKEPAEWLDRVPSSITREVERQYAASLMHLDHAVGRILEALEKAGRRENTLLVFTSDNGGSTAENNDTKYPADDYPEGPLPGSNQPLRGEKNELYEGGIRVPAIVSWPARLSRGTVEEPIHIADWMPTLCAIAGYEPERDLKWDGLNVWPLIEGRGAGTERTLYWTSPRARAVRQGNWKLIQPVERDGEQGRAELFDLSRDPYETTDLAGREPQKVKELMARMGVIARADGEDAVRD